MSWFAWFMAFLDSDLGSACGSNVCMALPRLILVVFVHVDVAPAAVLVVISHIKAANPPGRFRFWLTFAAATNWPKFLNALASFSRSVRFVVPVRVSSLVARCELCSRTPPGLVLAIAFDELWPPPAEALFPCVPEAPMLPGAPGVPDGRPRCAYVEEPRNNSVLRAMNGTIRHFIALFLLSETNYR